MLYSNLNFLTAYSTFFSLSRIGAFFFIYANCISGQTLSLVESRASSRQEESAFSAEKKELLSFLDKFLSYLLLPGCLDQFKDLEKELIKKKDLKSKGVLAAMNFLKKCYEEQPALSEKLRLALLLKKAFFPSKATSRLKEISSIQIIHSLETIFGKINRFPFVKKRWLRDLIFKRALRVEREYINMDKPITATPLQEDFPPQELLRDLVEVYEKNYQQIPLSEALTELGISFNSNDLKELNQLLLIYEEHGLSQKMLENLKNILKKLKLPTVEGEEVPSQLKGNFLQKKSEPLLSCKAYEQLIPRNGGAYLSFIPEAHQDLSKPTLQVSIGSSKQKIEYQVVYFITKEGEVFFKQGKFFFCFYDSSFELLSKEDFLVFLRNSELSYLVYGAPKKIKKRKSWLPHLSIGPYHYLTILQSALLLYLMQKKQSSFNAIFRKNKQKKDETQEQQKKLRKKAAQALVVKKKSSPKTKKSTKKKPKKKKELFDEDFFLLFEETIQDPAQKGMPLPVDPVTNEEVIIDVTHFTDKLEQVKLKTKLPSDEGNLAYYTNSCFFNTILHFVTQLLSIIRKDDLCADIKRNITNSLANNASGLGVVPIVQNLELLGPEEEEKAKKEIRALHCLFVDKLFELVDKIHKREEKISAKENGIVLNLFNQLVFLRSYYRAQVEQKKLGEKEAKPHLPNIYYHTRQEDTSELFQELVNLLYLPKLIENKTSIYEKRESAGTSKTEELHLIRVPLREKNKSTSIATLLKETVETKESLNRYEEADNISFSSTSDSISAAKAKKFVYNIVQLKKFLKETKPPIQVQKTLLEIRRKKDSKKELTKREVIKLALEFRKIQNDPKEKFYPFKDFLEKTSKEEEHYVHTLEYLTLIYEMHDFSRNKIRPEAIKEKEDLTKLLEKLLTVTLVRKFCDEKELEAVLKNNKSWSEVTEEELALPPENIKEHQNFPLVEEILKKKDTGLEKVYNEVIGNKKSDFNKQKELIVNFLKNVPKDVEEAIKQNKKWVCPSSSFFDIKKVTSVTKKTTVQPKKEAKYAVVQLLRFDNEQNKIKTPIHLPLTIPIFGDGLWKMCAFIEHRGSSSLLGHYTIQKILKGQENKSRWYKNDDLNDKMEALFFTGSEKEKEYFQDRSSSDVYMILYERVKEKKVI